MSNPPVHADHQDEGVITGSFSGRQIQVGARSCWDACTRAYSLTASVACRHAQILHKSYTAQQEEVCLSRESAILDIKTHTCTPLYLCNSSPQNGQSE